MIDVTIANFEDEVIAASMQIPVLVDFWAPWCGPCKSLGPVLEQLETEYAGRFKLVKINSDDEQQLAAAFGIRSIPTCVLMMGGQPVDGFMGAQSAGQVREFLDKHLPSAEEAQAEAEVEDAQDALAEGDTESALEKLQAAVAADAANDAARFDLIKLLVGKGQLAQARAAFAPAAPKASVERRWDSVQRWLDAIESVANNDQSTPTCSEFDAKIAQNKRDFEARHGKAQLLWAQGENTGALDELLEILMRDKAWSDDRARKTYIAILDIMEPPKVKVAEGQIPPEDPTVASYRRRLSMIVLS